MSNDKDIQRQFSEWCRRNRQSGNLAPLLAYLQSRLEKDKSLLVTQDLTLVPRLQGSARELSDLIDLINKE
jgi:hypothetical protein